MKTFIFTDITADILPDRMHDDFEILPFAYSLGEDHYDNVITKLTAKEFYNKMRQGAKTTTSMVSQYLLEERMTDKLNQGYDVIYFTFSSALSGTWNVANLVARELRDKFKDRKIAIVDTLNASLGEGLFVDYILRKRDSGATFDEIMQYSDSIIGCVCSYFTVDDLQHLARMGRVSKTAAFIGGLAQIKPVLYVNKLGELVPLTKVMSRKKALKALVDKMQEKMLPVEQQDVIFVGHGDCIEDAEIVKNMVVERFGIKNIFIGDIGPVIGSHTNAGVVALFFLGENKIESKDTHVNA